MLGRHLAQLCFPFILSIALVQAGVPSYYELMGVKTTASTQEIKQAFRRLALKYHPDKNLDEDAEERFVEIVEAYETLVDPGKRQQYDQQHQHGGHQQHQHGGQQHQRSHSHGKYARFFQRMADSFQEYVRKQEDASWEGGSGEDEHFRFDFDHMWDDLDQEEANGFKSAFQKHLEHHYTVHERAVREAVRLAKQQAAGGQALPGGGGHALPGGGGHALPGGGHPINGGASVEVVEPGALAGETQHERMHRLAVEQAQRAAGLHNEVKKKKRRRKRRSRKNKKQRRRKRREL